MAVREFRYRDASVKQQLDVWAEGLGFDPVKLIALTLQDKFRVTQAFIHDAHSEGDFIILKISTDRWNEPREFALFQGGTVSW